MLKLISKLCLEINLNRKTSLILLMMFFLVSHIQAQIFCGDLEGTSCDNCPKYSVGVNPDLMVDCGSGIQMILLIDESNSIWNSGVEQDVADGVNAFLQSLACSSVDIAIIEFGSVANFVVQNYTPVGDVVSGMEDYFNGIPFNSQIYSPNPGGLGGTNWQAALLQANTFLSADMVLLLTDGVPTTYTPFSDFPQSSYDYCGNGTTTQAAEIYNSVQLANAIKLQGTHMFVMGVGPVNTDFIADISGTDEFGEEHSIITADYFFEESFDSFIDSFAEVAQSLCPLVDSVEGSTICEGNTDGTISININIQATGPFSISINNNPSIVTSEYEIIIENLTVGTYNLLIESTGNCFGTSNQTVVIDGIPLPTLETMDTTICEGTKTIVDLTSLVTSTGNISYHSTQDDAILGLNPLQLLQVSPPNDRTYFVRSESIEDSNCFVVGSITVFLTAPPSCGASDAVIDCYSEDGHVQLNVFSDHENVEYTWFTIDGNIVSGSNTSMPMVNEPGLYSVTVTDIVSGCNTSCDVLVTENLESPTVSILSIDELCLLHNPIQLIAFPEGGIFSGEGVGPTGLFQVTSTGNSTITYTLQNEDNGCEGSDSITIQVIDCCEDETAFAYNNAYSTCFSEIDSSINRWGWSNGPLNIGNNYTFNLIAGAGRCLFSNGELVGEVSLDYADSGDLVVTYSMDYAQEPMFYDLGTVHVYIGCNQMPENIAPGQMPYHASSNNGTSVELIIPHEDLVCDNFYFIAHAEVSICNSEDSLDLTTTESNTDNFINAYPIPFKDFITIRYGFDFDTEVKIEFIDIHGRNLSTSFNKNYSSGMICESKEFVSSNNSQLVFLKVTTSRGVTIKKLISQ